MRKTKEHKVPLLRFPKFGGEWEKKQLGDMTNFASGGTPSKKISDYWNGTIPWISAASMHTDIIEKSEIYVTEEGARNGTKIASIDTVLLLVRGSMLFNRIPAGICVRPVAFNQDVKALSVDVNNSPRFLLFFIRAWEHHLLSLVTGTGIGAGKLDTDQLKSLPFAQPTLLEQQKIASFLSSVDTKIEQLGKKKSLLEQYKNGMMKKLFSQELRFKDEQGNEYPDWVDMKLGNISDIVGGGTPSTANDKYWEGDIQWFTPTEIKTKYLSESKRTITQLGLQKSSAKLLPVGTLLLSTRATVGDIGIATQICTTNQGFQSLTIKNGNSNEFWFYWIIKNKKEFLRRASGSTFLEINKTETSKIPVKAPHGDEQQQIANFLSAIDQKIKLVSTELELAQIFKKGLLQQMFI